MDFGDALRELKAGKRVARAGWNGKRMWIALTPGSVIGVEMARNGAAQIVAAEQDAGTYITIGSHIDMKAADGSIVIGWLASQTDMLADDWTVVT